MNSTIAVAGGGIVGLSIAWRLAQRGWKVTVFDRGQIAGEASWAGAGMLAPGGEVETPGEFATRVTEARRMYPDFVAELAAESKVAIDFQQNGAIEVAYSDREAEALTTRREVQIPLGITSKSLTAQQVITFWPRVRRDGLVEGAFYPGDAIVNPRDVTHALATACRARGVDFAERSTVERMATDADGVTVFADPCWTRFDAAVIASGAWSSQIDVSPGLPALPPATPVKGVLLGYHQPEQTCSTIVRHRSLYVLQRANGMLIAGATMEHTGFNRSINQAEVNDLVAKTGFLFPHLGETSPSEIWAGLRPNSETLHVERWQGLPIYLAYGHYRNGILLAPHTAERILDLIIE